MPAPPTFAARAEAAGWSPRAVLWPFAISRLALLLVAWFARYFHAWHLAGPDAAARGWAVYPRRLLDVWARWDAGWYLAIARDGYAAGPLTGQSRLAFYPAYPTLVGGLERLLPSAWRGTGALLAVAVLVSHAAALAAAAALFRHARDLAGEDDARRAVLYFLAFPTAFFTGCVYTEGLFLALAIGAFDAAHRGRWARAGLLGAAAALTRSTGVLLLPALAWLAVQRASAGDRAVARRAAWLALVPLAFAAWAAFCWRLTGDPLAAVHVQAHWGKHFAAPWTTLGHAALENVFVAPVDAALTVLAAAAGAALLTRPRYRPHGLFALLSVAAFAFTGALTSAGRYALSAFPLFLVLARAGRCGAFDRAWLTLSVVLQTLLFTAWARFYWAG